jgi:octaprenyl-diphosphate synthase
LYALVTEDFAEVQKKLLQSSQSIVPWLNNARDELLQHPGKQLRPLLVLLSAKACGYTGHNHLTLATILELIHIATLLHDDVIDQASIRHGHPSSPVLWGNTRTVLIGDFLYSRAFQLMITCQSLPIMKVLADTTNTLAEGELLQASFSHDPSLSIEQYLQIIDYKTAKLFEAATLMGPLLTAAPLNEQKALSDYGRYLGIAFQLMDDLLDYTADNPAFGKKVGHDFEEGKATFPLLYALKNGSKNQQEILQQSLKNGQAGNLTALQNIFEETKALENTRKIATEYIYKAEKGLKESLLKKSVYHDGLLKLSEFVIQRTF